MPAEMSHRHVLSAGKYVLPLILFCLFASSFAVAEKPNFVIILADDLGYGDLGPYGGWINVPNLDRMAAQGLQFMDFHSNGAVCSPTRAALMTGRYQQRAGIPGVIYAPPSRPSHYDGLQPGETTFAELLRSAGYVTGIFGKWHLGYFPKYNPVKHGFTVFRGYVSGNVDYFSHVDGAGVFDWWKNDRRVDERGYTTTLINRHAVEFIEAHQREPFCLYVPHEAPHSPYQGPRDDPRGFRLIGNPSVRQRLDPQTIQIKYREMVQEVDAGVGQILDTLKRLKLEKRTLVFFFSDNGATPNGSNGKLRGFKGSVWEGGHREPAVAWWPGRIKPGTKTDQLAMGFDLLPTMLELAGVPPPPDRRFDGVSLVPVLLRNESVNRGPVFWQYGDQMAMRDGDWKYIARVNGFKGPGLFNLAEDLGEQKNLVNECPERARKMAAALDAWFRDVNRGATVQPSSKRGPQPPK